MTIQEQINELATKLGVHPSSIESIAGMAADFLEKAYDGREAAAKALEADSQIAQAGTVHALEIQKKLLIRSHMNSQQFTKNVFGLINQN